MMMTTKIVVEVGVVIFSLVILQMVNGWGCLHKTTFTTTTRIPISLLPSLSLSSSSPSPSLLFHSKNNNQNIVQDKQNDNSSNNNNNNDDETTTNDNNDKAAEMVEEEVEVEWGVSYIGGDPCGSKYNDDPFDANNKSSSTGDNTSTPGMPDDMKARIQALAEKKIREQQ